MLKILKRALLPLAAAAAIIVPSFATATASWNCYVPYESWSPCNSYPYHVVTSSVKIQAFSSLSLPYQMELYKYDLNGNYIGHYGPWTWNDVSVHTIGMSNGRVNVWVHNEHASGTGTYHIDVI